jgi:uncharacterized protein YprB with RNaseH-like and TPR domain
MVRRAFPLDLTCGSIALDALFAVEAESFALLGRDPRIAGLNIRDFIFLDTETTGLTGGAGTCAFLIGVGFFEDEHFHIHQFFMRDYDEEKAMLSCFREVLGRAGGVVSFNGKAFDVPLVEERFILNRERVPLRDLPHLDLLFPARRLWRGLFEDCRLVTLEERILGSLRLDDVESRLIPQAYFDFVRWGEMSLLPKIFNHNRIDILALVGLAARMGAAVQDPLSLSGRELVKIGRIHREAGNRSVGRECFKAALEEGLDDDPLPFIELAKHSEHSEKDPVRAREIVLRLLESPAGARASSREDLGRRLSRLERKIAGRRGS